MLQVAVVQYSTADSHNLAIVANWTLHLIAGDRKAGIMVFSFSPIRTGLRIRRSPVAPIAGVLLMSAFVIVLKNGALVLNSTPLKSTSTMIGNNDVPTGTDELRRVILSKSENQPPLPSSSRENNSLSKTAAAALDDLDDQGIRIASASILHPGAGAESAMNVSKYLADCDTTPTGNDRYIRKTTATTSANPSIQMRIHQQKGDLVVSKAIKKWGCFNCGILRIAMAELSKLDNPLFMDIGSNLGLFALTAAAMGHVQVVAFEPFPENWSKICNTLVLNDHNVVHVKPHLTLFKTALTSTGPQRISYVKPYARNPSAVKIQQVGSTSDSQNLIEDEEDNDSHGWAITLDSLQETLPVDKPVVIKMDVEGHECAALTGALNYLSKVDLRAIFIEFSPTTMAKCDNQQSFLGLFRDKGLRAFRLADNSESWLGTSEKHLTWTEVHNTASTTTTWGGDVMFARQPPPIFS